MRRTPGNLIQNPFSVVCFVPVFYCSGDTNEKFQGESMALIGIGCPHADKGVARRFRVDFGVGFALSAGCGGGVVFVSCRFWGVCRVFQGDG